MKKNTNVTFTVDKSIVIRTSKTLKNKKSNKIKTLYQIINKDMYRQSSKTELCCIFFISLDYNVPFHVWYQCSFFHT